MSLLFYSFEELQSFQNHSLDPLECLLFIWYNDGLIWENNWTKYLAITRKVFLITKQIFRHYDELSGPRKKVASKWNICKLLSRFHKQIHWKVIKGISVLSSLYFTPDSAPSGENRSKLTIMYIFTSQESWILFKITLIKI